MGNLADKHIANNPNILAISDIRQKASALTQLSLPPSKLDESQLNFWMQFLKEERQIWQSDFDILNKAFEFARSYLVDSLVPCAILLEILP